MARCPVFRDFARDALARGTCEIGMHLHAWDSPPLVPLTADDTLHHAYLVEFPRPVMRAKIDHMTKLLQDTFGQSPVSHRAGRWAFDEAYAELLVEHGYRVDCSVTPHVSWASKKGDPAGRGGTDYRGFPEDAYYLDLRDIRRPGPSPLLELPVTIVRSRHPLARLGASLTGPRRLRGALRRFWPSISWLRPTGRNGADLLRIARWGLARRRRYVEFMLHSSELMPGGSATFRTAADIERLYEDLAALFAAVSGPSQGSTLAAFADRHTTGSGSDAFAAAEPPRAARGGPRV
jgi:peptidoglycan/xylan/chitin deacetylase (PgdA/CDA1 family)